MGVIGCACLVVLEIFLEFRAEFHNNLISPGPFFALVNSRADEIAGELRKRRAKTMLDIQQSSEWGALDSAQRKIQRIFKRPAQQTRERNGWVNVLLLVGAAHMGVSSVELHDTCPSGSRISPTPFCPLIAILPIEAVDLGAPRALPTPRHSRRRPRCLVSLCTWRRDRNCCTHAAA